MHYKPKSKAEAKIELARLVASLRKKVKSGQPLHSGERGLIWTMIQAIYPRGGAEAEKVTRLINRATAAKPVRTPKTTHSVDHIPRAPKGAAKFKKTPKIHPLAPLRPIRSRRRS